MKRFVTLIAVTSLFLAVCLLAAWQARPAQALPEYSAQTGEPCATCHLSPSGGGPRGTRGQAWVGSGKPSSVPDLAQALEKLGIHMDVDQSQYLAPAGTIPPAQPLPVNPAAAEQYHNRLKTYDGN